MEDQFLYAELIPSIILIIIALFCAEFIGRSKHIGFWFTFLTMLGIIPGIIALIFSPSVKNEPIKENKLYFILSFISACLALMAFLNGSINSNVFSLFLGISFASLVFYFIDLAKGDSFNENPKIYFGDNKVIIQEIKPISKIESLKNLKEKGILTEEEYMEKAKIVNQEIAEKKLKETEEYKQLQNLLNSQLLTQEEFENKVNILRQNL